MTLITYTTTEGERITETVDCSPVAAVERLVDRVRDIHLVADAAMVRRLQEMGILEM